MTPSPERSPLFKPGMPCSRLRPSVSRSALLGRERSCGRPQRRGPSQGRKSRGRPPVAPCASPALAPDVEVEAGVAASEAPAVEPLNISDAALDAAEEDLFHVTPSSSPASTKTDLDRELDDLLPFMESKEALSPTWQPDFSVDVDICLSTFGDDLTINVNMNGFDINLGKDDAHSANLNLHAADDDDGSTCSIGEVEVEDVDLFGEDDDDDVEEVEPEAVSEVEQYQFLDEEVDDFLLSRKEELTMSFAAEYTNQVIEGVLKGASASGELSGERLKALSEPPQVHAQASTCATADAEQAPPRVRLDVAAADARQAVASPTTRPASSRSLVSSRSRRRIIGAVVRSPAPAELADASSASAPPLSPKLGGFDPTSPKASGSGPLRSNQRSRGGTKDKSPTKKRSMTVFRMDMMDEASNSEMPGRSSSLARGYDALGAEIYSLNDRSEAQLSDSGRLFAGPETDWVASSGHSAALASAAGRAGLGRVQSASALALDLGLEQEPAHAPGLDSSSPWNSAALSKAFVIRSSSSTGSIAFSKAKKLQSTSLPTTSKRQGLLPELPASPSSAGSIAWSMRLAKSGARRGGLASVF